MRYLFLDEAGNFDFSERGTPHLLVCATMLEFDPKRAGALAGLRYELNDAGHDIESFHASANTPYVRQSFMACLSRLGFTARVYAVVLAKKGDGRKPGTEAEVYVDLFKMVLSMAGLAGNGDCPIYADRVPLQRARKVIMKAVREALGNRPVHFHSSASSLELQMADYCAWAVWRQVTRGDHSPWEALGCPHIEIMAISSK